MQAFFDLCSERTGSEGLIPFSKILWYAEDILGLEQDLAECVVRIIQEMDLVYISWMAKEREAGSKTRTASPASPPAPPGRSRVPRRRARR